MKYKVVVEAKIPDPYEESVTGDYDGEYYWDKRIAETVRQIALEDEGILRAWIEEV